MEHYSVLTLLPAALAVFLSFALRNVVVALLAGVVTGALIAGELQPGAVMLRLRSYLSEAIADSSHLFVLAFALLLGGLMRLLRASDGFRRLGQRVAGLTRTRRGGQLGAWGLGFVFFFDDYANTLLVGSSMGPAARRLRISREKLAFIVDATAAPIASLAPLSSWIAVELGYIGDQLARLGIAQDPYQVFLATVPGRYYPVLMLVFGLLVAWTGLDLGPMAEAEQRAHRDALPAGQGPAEATDPDRDAAPVPATVGVWTLPLTLGFVTLLGTLYWTGRVGALAAGAVLTPGQLLAHARSSQALALATAVAGVSALIAIVRSGQMPARAAVSTWLRGAVGMKEVVLVLLLAWALGNACQDLRTAHYVVGLLGTGFPPWFLPALVFLVSSVVSLATGTSWGTMGILFPLSVPLADQLAPGDTDLLLGTIASVLSGAVFGDHCSPISDTTIMSALAAECDQLAHVRTQLPYAVIVAIVAIVAGSLPVAYGLYGSFIGLCAGGALLYLILRLFGRLPASAL